MALFVNEPLCDPVLLSAAIVRTNFQVLFIQALINMIKDMDTKIHLINGLYNVLCSNFVVSST